MEKIRKGGQVALFIILAILIVGGIVTFFVLRVDVQEVGEVPEELVEINSFVEECIRITGENALERIGVQGGYFFVPDSTPAIDSRIPYYLHDGGIDVPSIEEIQESLSGFIYEELSFCILNFKDFGSMEINHELNSIETEIREDEVIFKVDYPVNVQKGDIIKQLNDFEVKLDVRLGLIYEAVHKIVDEERTHRESICLSCLYDLSEKNEFNIDMLDYGEDTTIFTIIDEESQVNNESYEFNFAIQYE